LPSFCGAPLASALGVRPYIPNRMYEFDEDTQVDEVAPGVYRGAITGRWNVGPVPNGGYVLSVGMAALQRALSAPDPLTITAHYLRPARVDAVEIRVEPIKLGRTFSTAMARMIQGGQEHARLLATYGDLTAVDGPNHIDAAPPEVPPLNDPVPPGVERPPIEIARRFEQRIAPETIRFLQGERAEHAEIRGWIRFADGRPPDVHCLGLVADAFPPPVLNWTPSAWIPTLELTVHFRARPAPGWLRGGFRTRFLSGGFLEEDGEIWDESGAIVALSRQLAMVPR
jgi:acyl-CoA thioesterase